MNVFVTSMHPRSCARHLCDKRLNKMILETAQIICTVINLTEGGKTTPYNNSHVHHPLIKWAEGLPVALPWLWSLGDAYGNEIIHRRDRVHASHRTLHEITYGRKWLTRYRPLEDHQFLNCARRTSEGLDFTDLPITEAYRQYLCARWETDKRVPVWTNRKQPSWR